MTTSSAHGLPGLVIAAPRSGAGKTTIAVAIMRALRERGIAVQPFKCGPDYIDPAFHSAGAGRTSLNLDTWAMFPDLIGHVLSEAGRDADIAIAEGAMGLFDGVASVGQSGSGASADLAALTGWPVVLVLDVSGQTETAAAVALGCATYRSDVTVAGVILNRVASPRHLEMVKAGFTRTGLTVLGAVMRDDALSLPERHLGLVQAAEIGDLERRIDLLAERLGARLDIDALLRAVRPARFNHAAQMRAAARIPPPGQRIAVAHDKAFSFFYPHIVLQWRAAGADILHFSPLDDEAPPANSDAVWLPGGYPELHGGTLANATTFMTGLRTHSLRGTPIHGECGGYMVLGRGLIDVNGGRHAMAGLLGLETSFEKRRLHLGYRRAKLTAKCVLGRAGVELLGHEFHYATTLACDGEAFAQCRDASGRSVPESGLRSGSVSGTFFHVIDRSGP